MPVGKGESNNSFNNFTIHPLPGDILYLYTDGFADQFGGPKGKKFKRKELNRLLLMNINKPLSSQEDAICSVFHDWKGSLEQVDDVCVIGIKL